MGTNKDRNDRRQLNNTKLIFEKTNEIKIGFKTKSTIMKNKDGSLIMENKIRNTPNKLI